MPMLETIICKSSLPMTSRMSSSTRATYWLVISRREPVGALTLITNWPGSVRGKKATPSSGNERQAHHKAAHDDDHGSHRTRQRFVHRGVVSAQHAVVAMIEAGNELPEQRTWFPDVRRVHVPS